MIHYSVLGGDMERTQLGTLIYMLLHHIRAHDVRRCTTRAIRPKRVRSRYMGELATAQACLVRSMCAFQASRLWYSSEVSSALSGFGNAISLKYVVQTERVKAH